MASWSVHIYWMCVSLNIPVWMENPDSSWMWRLRSWRRIKANTNGSYCEFRVDYCRFGTRWRKRTRLATNTPLREEVCLCKGGHSHWRLRRKHGNTDRTKLAEAYPRPLRTKLAAACLHYVPLTPCVWIPSQVPQKKYIVPHSPPRQCIPGVEAALKH